MQGPYMNLDLIKPHRAIRVAWATGADGCLGEPGTWGSQGSLGDWCSQNFLESWELADTEVKWGLGLKEAC